MNNPAYLPANKSIEIPDITIRKFVNGQATSFNRYNLDIFYIPEYDAFLLYQKDFQYLLARHTFIMIILFEDQSHRSYMLPNVDGHYILELKSPQNLALITNFETILRNYGQIEYRSGQEQAQPVQQVQPNQPPKKTNYLDWSNNFTKASKFLKDGGETLKYKLVNATNKIGTKETENMNPNQQTFQKTFQESEKTVEELKMGTAMVYLPRDPMAYLLATTRQIEAMTQSQFPGNQVFQPVQGTPWNELKRATLDSANNVWQGMEVAATNIYHVLKTKTNKKISKSNTQQYQQPNQPIYQPQQPQYQPAYQPPVNPTGLDSTKDPFSRSQSGIIPQSYQPLEDHCPVVVPNTTFNNTLENQFVASSIPANNGLYPQLSGPFRVGDNIENNGLNYVPYAESKVYVTLDHPYEDKKP